ncbi:hypothetical protein KSD_92280 [Ktedonobacter sp. SOSP1-85]|uniref:tetratricopeptide repeat protein n=1 Tax=Ktedonobacter sp. SOSP1-85 TaxID=2778367 RepID=UPI0019167127|nr:tetratricopeptide repeat protein [Ktedonobacter sp. SOSP1-85]GHO81457.1 hypothetical protein KSD_92280 [Ktedonobacter sp. SOSP1-85]
METSTQIGQIIGNYRITERISGGSFGSVYRAEHIHLKRRIVAIKLLHTHLESSTEQKYFTQEAHFLAQLEHPHILPLLDFGFSESQPYLITRYAPGGSFGKAIALDPDAAIVYANKGVALECLQRYEEALNNYSQAITLDPTYAIAYINKGDALSNFQRYEEALVAYNQAIALDPNDPAAYTGKGLAL